MSEFRCPRKDCASIQIEETRGGFVEQGEYDEQRGEYENEFDVDGYVCSVCGRTFYVSE